VVVGAHRATALPLLFAGGVAHRVLASGSSDVLVIPRGHARPTRSAAVRRLAADRQHSERSIFATQKAPS
jgi:hypothetical protein